MLIGAGVSGGVVEWGARAIRTPFEKTIKNREILIVPSSGLDRTPLVLNAADMEVEVRIRMSHGAIVAYEYELLAVVSVSGAARRIMTEQRVRIGGTQGTVELLETD
ncbi:PEP-utilizing enzyme [Halalkalicoccus salilacus]|uniref:PEP-utilizing enzyme n=1 Tax=Halalkalicoccus salilacus TaxID=3117459 RepID=UPI00300F4C88